MSKDEPNDQKPDVEQRTDYEPITPEKRLDEVIKQLGIVAEEIDLTRAPFLEARVIPRLRHLQDQLAVEREFGFEPNAIGDDSVDIRCPVELGGIEQ